MLKDAGLPPFILSIVRDKKTEQPFTGEYNDFKASGSYLCRRCGLALFRSQTKFHSGCGWPSFDETIIGAVTEQLDADGKRSEIICSRCHAHLGHVFQGEGLTTKNIRHCVNSLSLDFVANLNVIDTEEAIFAAGCFWGVEYYLKNFPGVLKTEVGYTGGHQDYPSYNAVCRGDTGHVEAVRVLYDPQKTHYEKLTKYFFEIHNPFQADGQGPDRGPQYLSVIFYYDEKQKNLAQAVMRELQAKNSAVATKILPALPFWQAEEYHQNYYEKMQKVPYCHQPVKRF